MYTMSGTLFKLITLVDITCTGVVRSNNTPDMNLKRNQQRNFETILQVLSLRTQPHISQWPYTKIHKINKNQAKCWFGETYQNQDQNVWFFYFTAEHPIAYDTDEGILEGLIKDFEQVPIITGLNETAKFMLPILYPRGSIKNVHISKIVN